MHPYKLYVRLPNGECAFFSWGTNDRALAIVCAKKQLDLTPEVTLTGFYCNGMADNPGVAELSAYLDDKRRAENA